MCLHAYIKLPPRVPTSKVDSRLTQEFAFSRWQLPASQALPRDPLYQAQIRECMTSAMQVTASITSTSLHISFSGRTHVAGQLYKAVDVDGSCWTIGETSTCLDGSQLSASSQVYLHMGME